LVEDLKLIELGFHAQSWTKLGLHCEMKQLIDNEAWITFDLLFLICSFFDYSYP
jgi:hypothetical protein